MSVIYHLLPLLMGILLFPALCSAAADCPFGSAIIEARAAFKDKLAYNMHEGEFEALPVVNYQCVNYDSVHKSWVGYRGSQAYVFPANKVHVWVEDGELVVDHQGRIAKKPRKAFLVWKGEFLTGENVEAISYDARENSWKVRQKGQEPGELFANTYPADLFDAYDQNGKALPKH
ncbi:MAG: hypothetical protein J5846_04950 [Desulfovibrio sp.]|nr:hypothetical protein [Desulfovibrio sp.]